MRILSQSQTVVKPNPNLLLTNENTQSISNRSKISISNCSKTKTKVTA